MLHHSSRTLILTLSIHLQDTPALYSLSLNVSNNVIIARGKDALKLPSQVLPEYSVVL